EVCERIERELETIRERLRESVAQVESIDVHACLDPGSLIRASGSSLGDSAPIGAACAIIVLLAFFRRIALTVLATLASPFSLLFSVVWMHVAGRPFALLSLMGRSLGIGMLVDSSIVVVENIVRFRERGLSPRQAAREGGRDVGLAVTLAALTTI